MANEGSVRVPEVDVTDPGMNIDCDIVERSGISYFRQRVATPDGYDTALGATTDAAVSTDTTGTLSAKLRGMVKILASVWDSVNGWFRVKAYLHDGTGNPLTAISDHIAGYGLFCISEPVGYQIAEGGHFRA